ncbi:MAG: SEC-C metal-binding domain-containing protein, partial [Thermoanaerobaculia bacterium]
MYDKLAGMTGTADTEAAEFHKIYKLEVIVVPTNQPMIRDDRADLVYRTEGEKFDAIAAEIRELHENGQPVLVGTVSIEKSERLGAQLKKTGIPHVVLNAKHHEREAEFVAQAGRKGAVTIATNMAGLYIIGTERHESRRIDNQLRGRSGRQGDPGASRFYLSLDDDLMRIFIGSERVSGIMERLGMEEGVPIEHRMVTRAIERAQKQVEGRNFEIRKHLLEYDDVMNKQREAIYSLRRNILRGKEGKEYILNAAEDIVGLLLDTHMPAEERGAEWNEAELDAELFDFFGLHMADTGIDTKELGREAVREDLVAFVRKRYEEKESALGAEVMALHLRYIMLQVIDAQWKDHLLMIDHLKEGIGLRGYGQRDPLIEYKRESFEMFQQMMERTQDRVVKFLWKAEVVSEPGQSQRQRLPEPPRQQQFSYSAPPKEAPAPIKRQQAKVGRNDPCPCGSGKKFKKCHGTAA